MEPTRKKCLPMYPAAINLCSKLPTQFADSIETKGSLPHIPSDKPDPPAPPKPKPDPPAPPKPKPDPGRKHKSKSKRQGKDISKTVVAAISGGTASGAAAHTAQQALRDVPTSRISRNPAFTPGREPTISNPAIVEDPPVGDVEMTTRPSISEEGLRNRGGIPRGTIAEEAPLLETETAAESAGAAESTGFLASVGGGAATAEEFGGAEFAPETLGVSAVVAAIGGGIAGGATYLFGHHH